MSMSRQLQKSADLSAYRFSQNFSSVGLRKICDRLGRYDLQCHIEKRANDQKRLNELSPYGRELFLFFENRS
jgi:hypothetical protein